MIWSIAWKNIWRNKTRSLVVVLAIFLGMTGGLFSAAVMNGAAVQRIKDVINLETSHIRITVPEFEENNEPGYYIDGDEEKSSKITSLPGVEAITNRIHIQAMASTASANGGVAVFGINPETEAGVFNLSEYICDTCGTFFETDKKNQIIIGDKLAGKLNLKLKSKVVLTFQDLQGNITGAAFKVTGIFHTNNNVMNEYRVFVRKNDLASVMVFPEDVCHEMYIRLNPDADVDVVSGELKAQFPGLDIKTWREIDPTVGMIDDFMDAMMYLFMFIILLALGFGIVNTMLMVVLERVRELGMLAAIGMTKKRIFRMIMLETILLSLVGGLTGMLAGGGLIFWTGTTGIDLTSIGKGLEAAGYSSFIYPSLGYDFFFGVAVLIVFTGIMASVFPARRATRLNPAEAVRVE